MFDRPVVLATKNSGKIKEFEALLSEVRIPLRSLKDFGPIPDVEENGGTFEENAYKKAGFTARVLGIPAIADDSGLSVKCLGGMPGVLSARYAGAKATDEANNIKLLEAMEGAENRDATFVCVIAVAVPRGPALIYEGTCHGVILREPRGQGGFGYDPLFYYSPLGKTFAEMTPEEKNKVSHRGKAMAELRSELDKVLMWLNQRLAEEP
jgi:XTP/dITP diphosphohydrolase